MSSSKVVETSFSQATNNVSLSTTNIRSSVTNSSAMNTSNEGPPSVRHIFINHQLQSVKYCSNSISTSKYNVLTFLPKFLFEQFGKTICI